MSIQNIAVEPGATPEKHELKTAELLSSYGKVKFLKPSRIKGVHTPDIFWLGREWEIKSPKGRGRWLLENTLQRATKQSKNIIVDLNRIKLPQDKCIRELKRQLRVARGIERLKVVTKTGRIIDLSDST